MEQEKALARLKSKDATTFSHETIGNCWLNQESDYINGRDFYRALRLRSNLMQTRAPSNKKSRNPADRLCRKCHKTEETAFHIMQECPTVKNARIKRHNVVGKNVTNFVKRAQPKSNVTVEPLKVTSAGTRLRPDVIVETPDRNYILEFAIPWDASQEYLQQTYQVKLKKYSKLAEDMSKKKKIPVIIGARGPPCADSMTAMKKIGVKPHQLKFLCIDALVGSLCVFSCFMS